MTLIKRFGAALAVLLCAASFQSVQAEEESRREAHPLVRMNTPRLISLEDILQERDEKARPRPARRGALTGGGGGIALPAMPHFLTLSELLNPALTALHTPEDDAEIVGQPWTGGMGIVETTANIQARQDALDAMGIGYPRHIELPEIEGPDPTLIQPNPDAPDVANWPPTNPTLLTPFNRRGRQNPQTTGLNFLSNDFYNAGFYPPDTEFAVGPSQITTIVNGHITVFNKDSIYAGALNVSTDTFFNSVRDGSSAVDPRVRYDRTSQRWFVTTINTPRSGNTLLANRILIAVSSGPVITSQSSFTFYQFAYDQVPPTAPEDTGAFGDFDTLGVDANALYIGINAFQPAYYAGSTAFVIRKSSVLSGGPIVITTFRQVADGSGGPMYTPQGADNDDPNATTGYFISSNITVSGQLVMRQVSSPGGTPTLLPVHYITVPSTYPPDSAPALGSNYPLDGSDMRLFAAQVHRNRLLNTTTLWTAHGILAGSGGIAASGGDRDAMRWYEIQNLNGTGTGNSGPNRRQAGTLYDPAATNPLFYTYGTIAMSGQGAAAMGSTATGIASPTKIALSGRLITDPLSSIQAASYLAPSTGAYNLGNPPGEGNTYYRWGDYSFTTVDPNDDMTFWTAQMYCNSANVWAVQIVQLVAAPPPPITSVTPNTLAVGQTTMITAAGTSTNGAAFFDPLPEYLNHISATFSNPGITAGSVAIVIPTTPMTMPVTKVTMQVTAAAGTPLGTYALTIKNPDGQSVTLNNAITIQPTIAGNIFLRDLTVSPPPVTPQIISIDFRTPGTTTVLFTKTVSIGASSAFQTGPVPPGTYDLAFKGVKYLRSVVPNVNLTTASATGLSVTLTAGDSDNNNVVDIGDFGVLVNSYGSDITVSGGGYDARADFNDDGVVDISDFGILVNAYGNTGTP